MEAQVKQYQKKQVDPYLKQKIMSATPEQLTAIALDIAISACYQKDTVKVNSVISELITTLDFEQGEVTQTFFELYRFIRRCVYKKQMDIAVDMLKEIRDAWNKAMKIV